MATGTGSLSHEYRYRLNIHIEDYAGPIEAITVPVLAWISIHQYELLNNPEKRKTGISFDIDFNNNRTTDILIRLDLTEKSIVTTDRKGRISIRHQEEPQTTPPYTNEFWELYEGDSLLTECEVKYDGQ